MIYLSLAIFLFQALPQLFGEGVLSTHQVDYGIAFTPDEEIAYVVRHGGDWGSRENPPSKIHRYVKVQSDWKHTGYAPFSDKESSWSDSDIFITQDGQKAFFVSNRPYDGKPGDGDPDIFVMNRLEGSELSWSEPVPVNEVNSAGYESSPVTDGNGNLYFASIRQEGLGMGDVYISRLDKKGGYDNPELLEGELNSEFGEWNLLVSPDASWIIFESSGRPEGMTGYGDLYLSRRNEEGFWESPTHLEVLNSGGSDLNPRILPESGQLIFASSKELSNTDVNFYSYPLDKLDFK